MHLLRPVAVVALMVSIHCDGSGGGGGLDAAVDAPVDASPQAPAAPTGVGAMAGDMRATVSWAAPSDGGSPILEYVVTLSPPPAVGDGRLTAVEPSLVWTSLTNGTDYTFTVIARNAIGDSPPSAPSAAVRPAGVPGGVTHLDATFTGRSAEVDLAWSAPADDNGRPITGYRIVSDPDGRVQIAPSSPYTFTGLRNRVAYTFTAAAINEVGTGAASPPSVAVTPLLPVCTGTITFTELAPAPIGRLGTAIASGDANGDLHPDLFVANYVSDTISVLLGHGDGTFDATLPVNVNISPTRIATADFDGDGDLELAVAGDSSVQVMRGVGNGTFMWQMAVPVGGLSAVGLAVADVDGDGDLDLVTANQNSHNVSVVLGNGDGTFLDGVTYPAFNSPKDVVATDVNVDGHVDLLVIHTTAAVALLLGNGAGGFAAPSALPFDGSHDAILAADLDDDGHRDLVLTNGSQLELQVRRHDGLSGFGPVTAYPGGQETISLSAGDFDGDGDLDLVKLDYDVSSFTARLAAPAGVFPGQIVLPVGDGAQPRAVLAVDIDHDTDADVLVVRSGPEDVAIYRTGCQP